MQTLNFLFAPGIADVDPATVRVDLWAKCFGAGGTLGDSFSCTASADPLFVFDQAAFDQVIGSQTFPLANYFQFEFSDGVVGSPVPEPSYFFLTVGALAFTLLKKRSRS